MRKQQELESTHLPPDPVWVLIQSRGAPLAKRGSAGGGSMRTARYHSTPVFFHCPMQTGAEDNLLLACHVLPSKLHFPALLSKGLIMHSFCCHQCVQPRCAGSDSFVTACRNAEGLIACFTPG